MDYDNLSLHPGTIIHGPQLNYKVIKKLGQGGFGITYLVEAPVKIGNIVVPVRFALKEHFISSLCSREGATQTVTFSEPVATEVKNSMRSFIKEARRLQDLDFSHRNIVKINEVFEANNTAYYVMEYLEGETLERFVEREGPLSFEQASYFLRPVAEAVAELHERNLTHYDIKPGNIIIARGDDGEPPRAVLIDFGLSKHYDHEGKATSTVASGGYSPGYSPVEQYAGIKTFTPQADVYALAATLWFCLKGEAPAESVLGPVNTIDADLAGVASPRLIDAMRHAMTVLSDQRTPDAAAFVREVFDSAAAEAQSRVTQSRPVNSTPPPPPSKPTERLQDVDATLAPTKSRAWVKWAIIGAAALVGIVLAIVLVLPGKEDEMQHENEVILTAANDEVEEVVPEEAVEVEPAREETKTADTVVAVPRTEEQPTAKTIEWTSAPAPKESTPKVYGRTSYNNCDLATVYNGEPRFFSIDEWNAVPDSEKSKYTKKGVVVKGGSVPAGKDEFFFVSNPSTGYASDFIVALKDNGNNIKWDEAMSSYTRRLPDIYQAYFMAKNRKGINSAITAFGGDNYTTDYYWTCTEYTSSDAWCVAMSGGFVRSSDKTHKYRVRAVAPVPVAKVK